LNSYTRVLEESLFSNKEAKEKELNSSKESHARFYGEHKLV
jgi:hypothetical protein